MPPIEFLADPREAGQTIATVLRKRFQIPWSQVKRLIERGHVRVAGFACTDPGHRVKHKNRVWIREGTLEIRNPKLATKKTTPSILPKQQKIDTVRRPEIPHSNIVKAPESAFAIAYQDEHVIVVYKSSGLTTLRHRAELMEAGSRARRYLPATLQDLLASELKIHPSELFAVHRLDRDTSGLIVFARNRTAARHLARQFRNHTVERAYLALVRGKPQNQRIETILVRDRGDGRRGSRVTQNEDGKLAITHISVIEQHASTALVECRLETGRTHQVRIHLGEAGTPLCGETVYDRPLRGFPIPDPTTATWPMLHAYRLGFVHPGTDSKMAWDAEAPADFREILQKLRKKTSF